MWQVLQSLDAAVHIDEATRQAIKTYLWSLERINADMTASEGRSQMLTFTAQSHDFPHEIFTRLE